MTRFKVYTQKEMDGHYPAFLAAPLSIRDLTEGWIQTLEVVYLTTGVTQEQLS
jgi:hypothetical protein